LIAKTNNLRDIIIKNFIKRQKRKKQLSNPGARRFTGAPFIFDPLKPVSQYIDYKNLKVFIQSTFLDCELIDYDREYQLHVR
jgi:hypothetical protein